MAEKEKPQAPPETDQQRTERIRHEERKAHAARGMQELQKRFGD